jgi:hypothetical protein
MAEDVNQEAHSERANEGEMSESEIDANVEGTFPASDPPSWTLGSDHGVKPTDAKDRDGLEGD